ncbi:hypothetical protein WR25_14136 [Diploscapter pachys]|uniref:RNA polymerase II-associated protein 3 n=1 Tax=Diploscapter pachys TaxID=2018661 RepID=A0A2A2KPP3_9BILA|nr:hypothetical protein WR25_14136 [Diploscapter pachys]
MSSESDESALKLKEQGNVAYKEKRFNKAVELYTKSLVEKRDATVLCNRAQASLQLKNWMSTVMDCTAAIEMQNDNSKAFYRRACALRELGIFEQARKDLIRCGQIEANAAADKLLLEIKDKKNAKVMDISRVERGEELTGEEQTEWKKVDIEVIGQPSAAKAEEQAEEKQEPAPESEKRPSIPAPPTSFTQFALHFNSLAEYPALFAQYFLSIDMSKYKTLFDDLLEEAHLKLLVTGFAGLIYQGQVKPASVARCLLLLATVSRFDLTILFLNEQDKDNLRRICASFAPQDKSLILQTYGIEEQT